MGKILSIIASIVVILAGVWYFTKKPPIVLDANGFPLNPKLNDTYTKDGIIYQYNGTLWINTKTGSNARIGFLKCPDGTLGVEVNGVLKCPESKPTTRKKVALKCVQGFTGGLGCGQFLYKDGTTGSSDANAIGYFSSRNGNQCCYKLY